MKKLLVHLGIIFCTITCFAPKLNAATIWYWGDDPNSDYVLTLPSNTHDAALPFTLVTDEDFYLNGLGSAVFLNGFDPSVNYTTRDLDAVYSGEQGMYSGTTYITNAFALSAGTETYLPVGVYTPYSFYVAGRLNYDTVDDTQVYLYSLNSFSITVPSADQPSAPVPEPATILLLGTGMVGLAGFRKKMVK